MRVMDKSDGAGRKPTEVEGGKEGRRGNEKREEGRMNGFLFPF